MNDREGNRGGGNKMKRIIGVGRDVKEELKGKGVNREERKGGKRNGRVEGRRHLFIRGISGKGREGKGKEIGKWDLNCSHFPNFLLPSL